MFAVTPDALRPTLSLLPMVLLLLLYGAGESPHSYLFSSAIDILVAKQPSGEAAAAAAPPERDEAKADDGGAKATLARLLLWGGTSISTRSEQPLEALLNPDGSRSGGGSVSYLPPARPQLPEAEVMRVLPFVPSGLKRRARCLLLSLQRLGFPMDAASVVVHHLVIDSVP
jgi:hypothetical protein